MVVVIILGVITFASSYGGATSGFSRIVNTVETQDENGRDFLRAMALNSFLESPILGHGFGSVFYEIGEYSHNCVTDALVETGIIGAGIFVFLIIYVWKKSGQMMRYDITNFLWRIIFLDGIVMSLFSGYYLAHLPIYWTVGFVLSFKREKRVTAIKSLSRIV